MFNKCLTGLLIWIAASTIVTAQTRLIENTTRQIIVEFSLPAPQLSEIELDGQTYTRIDYDGARMIRQPGAPMLPFSIANLAIPPGAAAKMSYEILGQEEYSGKIALPGIPSVGVKTPETVRLDESIYSGAAPFPATIVEITEPADVRFMRTVALHIQPVQYLPAAQSLRVIKKIRIRIDLSGGQLAARTATISDVEQDYHRRRLLNYEASKNWGLPQKSALQRTTVDYSLNSGTWLKIPVSEEGIYRITGSNLQDQGVNLSTVDITTIQMFNHGGDPLPVGAATSRPEDLNEVAISVNDANSNGLLDAGESILFFGRATKGWRNSGNDWSYSINPYGSTNYYLLTFNQNTGKRMEITPSQQITSAVTPDQFTDLLHFSEDNFSILESGLDWYWERFQGTAEQKSISFNLPNSIVSGAGNFSYRLKGGSGAHWYDNRSYRYTTDLLVNGSQIADNIIFTSSSERINSVNITTLNAGSNSFTVDYTANLEGSYMFLDYFEIRIPRRFQAENNFLKFYYDIGAAPVAFSVTNLAASNNRVWDVSDFANVRQITPLSNSSTVTFHQPATPIGSAKKSYYVFADAAIKSVSGIEQVENRPNLRDPNRVGKLLILTSKELYDVAQDWENFKENQAPGEMEAERILVDDIFLEFSSGVGDPAAIRDFLKYAYENWGSNSADPARLRPHYVQLLGDGSYDYRNIAQPNYVNHIPTFQITYQDDITSRCTDLFYTAFAATSISRLDPQIPIARLPANSPSDVTNYINKMRAYQDAYKNTQESYAGWQSTITLVADDECAGGGSCGEYYHTDQSEKIFRNIPQKFDVTKIFLVDYDTQAGGLGRQKPKATTDLLNQINRGTLIVNFFGHGDPNTWAHEQALTRARDLPLIQNSGRLPIWIAATCTWGKYDNPAIPSMAEEMVWAPEGGGIISLAASRPTFSFDNLFFVEDFVAALFYNIDETRRSRVLGDAFNIALSGDTNDQKYHLFGDVALQLADPEKVVRVDNITSAGSDTLKALSKVSLNAAITDSTGQILSNFNGKALIRVYDAVDSVFNTIINRRYIYQGGTIFKGVVSVTNGLIEDAGFIVPKSIKYRNTRTGRLSIYAWSDDGDAAGFENDLLFFGTASQVVDAEGPGIDFSFAEQPDFFDGDYVQQQSELVVELVDENGINLTGEVGHRIELIIDDNIRKDVTEFFVYDVNSFTSGKLRYALPTLSNGTHTLKISAWDNLNNYSESQLSFTTASASNLMLDRVINYPNPFADETTFTFQYQSPNGIGEASIKIYTVYGRLIREIRDTARAGFNKITWDGRDEDGDLVANGVYLYKVVVDDGEKTLEKIEKLAITR